MKWYDSVKVKMIGFFLFISILFLISIVTVFYMMREENLPKSASKEVALITSNILQNIRSRQIRAEETVETLASVTGTLKESIFHQTGIITAILSSHRKNSLDVVSSGIWFEPDALGNRQSLLFVVAKDIHSHDFHLVTTYPQKFRRMEFYTLAKQIPYGHTAWTGVYTDPMTHIKMITVVSPIYVNKRFIGAASIDIAVQNSIKYTLLKHIEKKEKSYLIMLDKKGNFIGKSKFFNHFSHASNIFQIKNPAFHTVMHYLAPVLREEENSTLCYANIGNVPQNSTDTLKESICFIENDPILHSKSILAIYHFPRTHWSLIVGIPQEQALAHYDRLFYKILFITILLTLLATILGYIILRHIFVKPIEHINRQLQRSIIDNTDTTLLRCQDRGEIGMLVENLNTRTINLARSKQRESKEHQLRLAQEEMLIQQSKMAAMGEMMDSVAHQWKQPLNALTLYSELIRNDFEEGSVDQAYIEKFRKDIQTQIDHMVTTLDEFRSFFRPDKERAEFNLLDVVNSALFLAKDDILKHHILVRIEQKDTIIIDGYANEFKHLILNIINNAKDAFLEHDVKQRLIRIRLIADTSGKRLEIEDNAGGIPETVIDTLFKANVTTKKESKGTGIGLYMSQKIARKHNALLKAENREQGACFIVIFQGSDTAADTPAT
jgi:signal transduction histidine kinase